MAAWWRAVDLDPELTTASTITRTQFVDHVPAVLDAFERRLAADESGEKAEAIADQKEHAAQHGLHRWQQGYDLRETMRESGHLHLCLLSELQSYSARHLELETAEGDGTTFRVTFPRAYRDSAVAAHQARPSSGDESAAPL